MKRQGVISFAVLLVSLLFVFSLSSAKIARASLDVEFNQDFMVARAVVLANFSSDEQPTEPEIRYLMPGEKPFSIGRFDRSQRTVNVFDPRYGIGGIQATFTAPSYQVLDGEQALAFSSFKKSVGDILQENSVVLAKEDIVSPAVADSPSGNKILITRVSEALLDEFETLPYQSKEVEDPTLERGLKNVTQVGKSGQKTITYRVRRENGIEVSKTKISENITDKPQDKITKIGTKVVVLSSHQGIATIYNLSNCSVVSANYRKGTTVRITNLSNGVRIIKTVDCTWGTAAAADSNVLDLSRSVLAELNYTGGGAGPSVLVEEIKN